MSEMDLATVRLLLEESQAQVGKLHVKLMAIAKLVGAGEDEDVVEAVKRRMSGRSTPPARVRERDSKATT